MTNSIIQAILVFLTALASSLFSIPLILKLAQKLQLFDAPYTEATTASPIKSKKNESENWRKIHSTPVPRLGGIAIFIGSTLGYLLLHPTGIASILVPGVLIFCIGVTDDLFHVSAKWRLILQIILAYLAVAFGNLNLTYLSLTPQYYLLLPSWCGTGLAVFILVGTINASNMIDGLDGLAAGLLLIAFLLLSFISYFHFQSLDQILILTLPLVGALLGFLKHNTHPAKIFMGDGGSNFLGYFIGIFILLLASNKTLVNLRDLDQLVILDPFLVNSEPLRASSLVPFFSILLAFAVPIYDSACVVAFRIKNKKNPFHADNTHFHHALLRIGLSHSQSVSSMYFIGLIVGIAGLVPIVFDGPKYQFAWVAYVTTGLLLLAIVGGRKANKDLIDRIKNSRFLLSRSGTENKSVATFIDYWEALNKYLLYAFLAILPLFSGLQKEAIGYGAVIAAILVFISFFFRGSDNDFIDSLLLSIGVCLLLVVNNQHPMTIMLQGKLFNIHYLYNYLFVFLFFSAFLFVIFTMRKRYLEISPTDFLLASLPLILLLTPEPYRELYKLNIIGLRCLVVFMVLRMFARRNRQIVHHARVLTLLGLVYVILTSLLGFRIVYL